MPDGITTVGAPLPKSPVDVRGRLTGIAILFAVAILGILVHTTIIFQSKKFDAILIDIAGRQRMLHQEHLKQVLLASQGFPADYLQTRKEAKRSLEGLIQGGPVVLTIGRAETVELPPAPNDAVRQKLLEQEVLFEALISQADEFLRLSRDGTSDTAALNQMLDLGVSLHETTNEAVKLLDSYVESKSYTIITWEIAVALFIGMLGVLLTRQAMRANKELENQIAVRKRAEGETHRAQALISSIVENLPNMVFVKDAKYHRFVEFNKAGEELVGYSREEMIGKNDYGFFPKEEADFFWAKDCEVLEGGRLIDIPEEPINTRTKGQRFLHTKKVPILGVDGAPEYLLGISEDITERKQAEEALRESQAKLYRIADAIPGAVYQYRLTPAGEQTMLYISRGVQDLFGLTAEQVQHDFGQVWKLLHPDDVDSLWGSIQKSARTLQPWSHEFRIIVNGDTKWVRGSSVPELPRPDGSIVWNGILICITQQKRTEQALAELSTQNEQILQSAGEGIYGLDLEGNATFVNPAAAHMTGYGVDELLGKSMHAMVHHTRPDGTPYLSEECHMYATLRGGGVQSQDTELFWRKDGSSFPVAYTSTPIRSCNGKILGAVITFRDITERKRAEDALRESEAKLRAIIESSIDAIMIKDSSGCYLLINEAGANFLGRSVENILGKRDDELFDEESAKQIMMFDRHVMKTQTAQSTEEFLAVNGMKRWFFTSKVPYWSRQGEVIGVIGVAHDITERKRAEDALRKSEERYRALYEDNPCMYFTVSPDGTVLSVNQFGTQQLGYSVQELVGRHVLQVFHPDDIQLVRKQFEACLAEPRQVHHWEFRKVRKDGAVMWVKETARVVQDTKGTPVLLIVCEDITERKRAEKALQDSEGRYALATAEARVGVWDWNLKTGEFYIDPNVKAILGYTDEEIPNDLNRWMEHVHPDDREDAMTCARLHIEGCTLQYVHEHRLLHKDGSVRWVLVRGVAHRDAEGKAIRMIGTDMDITERKRAEEELRKSEEKTIAALRHSDALKTALLSSVSHELRTPLTAIKSMVSSVTGGEKTLRREVREEFLEGIHQEVDYLNRLVDNLLDMSKIEAGTLEPRREWHLLEDLVEGAIRRVGKGLQNRPFDVRLAEDLPSVCVDGVQIQQVFVNLLDNAIKYSPSESSLRLEAETQGEQIEVRVSNAGSWIPESDLERVFERFYRVRLPGEQSRPGTGLGLAICKGIIEAHGGRIWATSKQGGETSIAFRLPCGTQPVHSKLKWIET